MSAREILRRLEADGLLRIVEEEPPARCPVHRAFEPDNCPGCGTAARIGR